MIKLEATVFLQTQFLLLATSNFIVDNFLLTLVFGNFVIFMIFLQTFTLFYDFFHFFLHFLQLSKKFWQMAALNQYQPVGVCYINFSYSFLLSQNYVTMLSFSFAPVTSWKKPWKNLLCKCSFVKNISLASFCCVCVKNWMQKNWNVLILVCSKLN